MAKKSNTKTKDVDAVTKKKGRPKGSTNSSKSKKSEQVVKEPEAVKEPSAEEQIYGADAVKKNISQFPVSDLQTLTKGIIKEYGIQAELLPQNIIDAINEFIVDFGTFVLNPMNFGLVKQIQDKDAIAVNLLKEWVEPRKELLLKYKKEEEVKEEVKVLPPVTAGSVPSQSNNNVPEPTLLPSNSVHQNTFLPRTPENTYVHSVNNPPSSKEDKNIHYEILAKTEQSVIAQNHAHQNWQGEQKIQEPVIDRARIFQDYCHTINNLLKSSFQLNHWGFLPESDAKAILNTLDKSYQYELVSNAGQSYIKIINGTETNQTDFFTIR